MGNSGTRARATKPPAAFRDTSASSVRHLRRSGRGRYDSRPRRSPSHGHGSRSSREGSRKHRSADLRHHSRRPPNPDSYVPSVPPSVLDRMETAYGKGTHEIGYQTDGHQCVTKADLEEAHTRGSSLLYGEVLPPGVAKMLDAKHLHAASASVLMDLGSGTGKLALQAFLMYENLREVYGLELCKPRFALGEAALLRLAATLPHEFAVVCWVKGSIISIAATKGDRQLTLQQGNLLDTRHLNKADIIILETDLPQVSHPKLVDMFHSAAVRPGSRMLSYLNLREVWAAQATVFPYVQLETNRSSHDRFLTSWSYAHGHHFYLWKQTNSPQPVDTLWQRVDRLPHSVPAEDTGPAGGASPVAYDSKLGAPGITGLASPRHAASPPMDTAAVAMPDPPVLGSGAGSAPAPGGSGTTPRGGGGVARRTAAGSHRTHSSVRTRRESRTTQDASDFITVPVVKPQRTVESDSDDVSPPGTPPPTARCGSATGAGARRGRSVSSTAVDSADSVSPEPEPEGRVSAPLSPRVLTATPPQHRADRAHASREAPETQLVRTRDSCLVPGPDSLDTAASEQHAPSATLSGPAMHGASSSGTGAAVVPARQARVPSARRRRESATQVHSRTTAQSRRPSGPEDRRQREGLGSRLRTFAAQRLFGHGADAGARNVGPCPPGAGGDAARVA